MRRVVACVFEFRITCRACASSLCTGCDGDRVSAREPQRCCGGRRSQLGEWRVWRWSAWMRPRYAGVPASSCGSCGSWMAVRVRGGPSSMSSLVAGAAVCVCFVKSQEKPTYRPLVGWGVRRHLECPLFSFFFALLSWVRVREQLFLGNSNSSGVWSAEFNLHGTQNFLGLTPGYPCPYMCIYSSVW